MKRNMMRLILVGGLLLGWNASALNLAGIHLVDKMQLGEASLQLNGAGVRTKWFFKVYVAALYLPQKLNSAEAVIDDEREHRIAMYMLRELSGEKLFDAFSEAIKANHPQDVLSAMDVQMKEMAQIFESVNKVKEGDIINIDYLPASGTRITVNGTERGSISGAAFNRAILKIWLGKNPVQEDMKKGMLGG